MNLNNLRPAWRRFRLLNSMQSMSQQEIMLMLEAAENTAVNKTNRLVLHIAMFVVLVFFFQGG